MGSKSILVVMAVVLVFCFGLPKTSGELVYFNDFTESVGSEWSSTQRDTTPIGNRNFLGLFDNETVSLTFSNMEVHNELTVSLDLFVAASWDGNRDNGDFWELRIANGQILLNTTFDNHHSDYFGSGYTQSYPDNYLSDNPAFTGASEINTLGYTSPYNTEVPESAVYHLSFTFPHSANELVLNFSGSYLELDEGWGLDNVSVVPEPVTLALLGLGGLIIRRRK